MHWEMGGLTSEPMSEPPSSQYHDLCVCADLAITFLDECRQRLRNRRCAATHDEDPSESALVDLRNGLETLSASQDDAGQCSTDRQPTNT